MGWTHGQNEIGHTTEISETKKQEGCRKRGRPQLRWEDCLERDLRNSEEEQSGEKGGNNRDQWKNITNVAVHRSDQ